MGYFFVLSPYSNTITQTVWARPPGYVYVRVLYKPAFNLVCLHLLYTLRSGSSLAISSKSLLVRSKDLFPGHIASWVFTMSEVTDFTALPLNLKLSQVGLHRFDGSLSRVFEILVFCFFVLILCVSGLHLGWRPALHNWPLAQERRRGAGAPLTNGEYSRAERPATNPCWVFNFGCRLHLFCFNIKFVMCLSLSLCWSAKSPHPSAQSPNKFLRLL